MKYSDYQNKENSFRSLAGLSLEHFRALFLYFKEAHDEYFSHYDMDGNYRNNRRRFTIYKSSPLPTVEDRLFFILVYLKNNPLQEYHAASFGMTQKHCSNFIHVLYPILEESLVHADAMPAEKQEETCRGDRTAPPGGGANARLDP